MCGIAGIYSLKIDKKLKIKVLKMGELLTHRGPDESGIFQNNNLILIHKRLSIIDLKGGQQPIENKGLILIANGEIYNDHEIRKKNKDFIFKTKSDCESILCLYYKYGVNGFLKLRGMYAFAIYNKKTNELILGRDPFGIKPLYFSVSGNNFIFSSEAQSIIKSDLLKPSINEIKQKELLQLQFSTGRESIFKNINRVRPGEIITIKDSKITESKIFNKLEKIKKYKISKKRILFKLTESIKLHQRSDVPYGIFFSGGIDSTLVLYLMSLVNSNPIKTYSVIFPGQNNQKNYLNSICNKFNSKLKFVEFNESDFWNLIPVAAKSFDDPVLDYAILPTFKLAQEAKKEIKVVLTGEGGDELFAGYGRYRSNSRNLIFKKQPFKKGAFKRFSYFNNALSGWDNSMKNFRTRMINFNLTELQKVQFLDFEEWLPNDLLIKLDRCLMANSIEGRTPLVDLELFSELFGVSDNEKISNGLGKYYIRKFLNERLPFYNSFEKKNGFTVPLNLWMPAKYKILSEILPKIRCLKEIFLPQKIKELCLNLRYTSRAIVPVWRLLFYSLWYLSNFENKKIDGNAIDVLNDNT